MKKLEKDLGNPESMNSAEMLNEVQKQFNVSETMAAVQLMDDPDRSNIRTLKFSE